MAKKSLTKKDLTPNQRLFLAEYLIDRNATRAYKKAYPNVRTEKAAQAQASRLLGNAIIQLEINKALEKQEKRTLITADEVLKNIMRIANKAEEAEKLSDALKGQELLGRHLKMFTDKFESTEKTENKVEISFSPESNELLKEIAANASSRG